MNKYKNPMEYVKRKLIKYAQYNADLLNITDFSDKDMVWEVMRIISFREKQYQEFVLRMNEWSKMKGIALIK